MMTKERLQELIEQKATIYSCYISEFYNDRIIDLSTAHFYIEDDMLFSGNTCWAGNDEHWYLDSLFETKEDAEFVANNWKTRVERFEPPLFEKIEAEIVEPNKVGLLFYNFHLPDQYTVYGILKIIKYSNGIGDIKVGLVSFYGNEKILLAVPLTKDNYYKAVEYARKLFERGK